MISRLMLGYLPYDIAKDVYLITKHNLGKMILKVDEVVPMTKRNKNAKSPIVSISLEFLSDSI